MEVIKHGNTYKETECTKCNAILSYCDTDIKHKNINDNYFGEWHYSYREYIICPECGHKINFSYIIDGEETVK